MKHSDVAFIIPSRLGSTRLPKKALADIGGKTMIEHVVSRLSSGAENNLYVATDSLAIAEKVKNSDGIAIMTSEDCQTGSDRAFEAFQKIPHSDKIKYIINVQGDMPFVDYKVVKQIVDKLKNSDFSHKVYLLRVLVMYFYCYDKRCFDMIFRCFFVFKPMICVSQKMHFRVVSCATF